MEERTRQPLPLATGCPWSLRFPRQDLNLLFNFLDPGGWGGGVGEQSVSLGLLFSWEGTSPGEGGGEICASS